jgi:hypothetical protein
MNQTEKHAERLENLTTLEARARDRSARDRPFKRAIGTLEDDLTYITAALDADPESWRLNRAFHVVHVPSLITVLAMLEDIDQLSHVSQKDKDEIYASVQRAASLACDVRQRSQEMVLDKAKIELRVLGRFAKPPIVPLAKPSRLTRVFDSLSSTTGTAWDATKSGALGAASTVQNSVSGTASRAVAIPMFAKTLQKSVTGAMSDTFARPIAMRLNAGTRAIESGVGTGVGLGLIAGILFPPLLPLTAGGAVLAAMKTWRSQMLAAQELNEVEREIRLAELRTERAAALAQLTQGSGSLQMETEDLSMTLDSATGEADAIVLSGQHAGSLWSNLSPAEKAEAALTFADGASSILRILAAAVTDG